MDKHQQLDELFAVARKDATVQSFDATQQLFLSSLTPTGHVPASKKSFTLKNWIIMLTTISTITCTLLFFSVGNHSRSLKQNANKTDHAVIVPASSGHQSTVDQEKRTIGNKQSITAVLDVIEEQLSKIGSGVESISSSEPTPVFDWNKKVANDTPYEFPKLTEKEIAETKKKKKSMLKALQKFDKNAYAYIPSGTFKYDSTMVSVQAFYMSKSEVTNFEYRTFLFDLLLQDRKAEFLVAKPDQAGWVRLGVGGKPFQEHYFSHPVYNEYPVVNVSKAGIELYCKWLSEELRKFVGEKKEANYNDVRLPLRVEWVKAASVEGKQLPYPWDGQFMRDSKGLFQANFAMDSITNSNLETVPGNDITAPVKSYWPNAYGLYNMSGNVAEMVYNNSTKEVLTAGGSWRNSAAEVKIYAPDNRKNVAAGAADIGFRVVCTSVQMVK